MLASIMNTSTLFNKIQRRLDKLIAGHAGGQRAFPKVKGVLSYTAADFSGPSTRLEGLCSTREKNTGLLQQDYSSGTEIKCQSSSDKKITCLSPYTS